MPLVPVAHPPAFRRAGRFRVCFPPLLFAASFILSNPLQAQDRSAMRFTGGFMSGTPSACEVLLTGSGNYHAADHGGDPNPQQSCGVTRMQVLLRLQADGHAWVQALLEGVVQNRDMATPRVIRASIQGLRLRTSANSPDNPTALEFSEPLGGAAAPRHEADARLVRNFIHGMLGRDIVYASLRIAGSAADRAYYGPVRWDLAEGPADEKRVRDCMAGLAKAPGQ